MLETAKEWLELVQWLVKSAELLLVGAGIGIVLVWRAKALDRRDREEASDMREQQLRQHAATMEALRVTAIKMGYLPTVSPVSEPSPSSTPPNSSGANSHAEGERSTASPSKPSRPLPGSGD